MKQTRIQLLFDLESKGFPLNRALPLHRTPWILRWMGPWRLRKKDLSGWIYITREQYFTLFGRESI